MNHLTLIVWNQEFWNMNAPSAGSLLMNLLSLTKSMGLNTQYIGAVELISTRKGSTKVGMKNIAAKNAKLCFGVKTKVNKKQKICQK